jgi:hypothetical protein
VTRRTRGNHHGRRAITILAFVVSLVVLALSSSRTADAARVQADVSHSSTASSTSTAPPTPTEPNSGRPVVRVGAFLFALGSIATYVASGTRRNAVREVDLDGHDI